MYRDNDILSYTDTALLFVYGTLKKNLPNHYLMLNERDGFARFVSNGITNEPYPLVIGTRYNIPFLLNVPNTGHRVHGEIYEMDDNMMTMLDFFENHPSFYLRRPIEIVKEDG